MNYLYGAAVQGIQGFIFQTNELKDIVGASELVENICTVEFARLLYGRDLSDEELLSKLEKDSKSIINAAGNIKYLFETEEECARVVRKFPQTVVGYAPGITISQAVIMVEDDPEDFEARIDDLEERLRIQRNRPMQNTMMGVMGALRSRKTNMPVVDSEIIKGKKEYYDAATLAKRYVVNENKQRRDVLKLAKTAFGTDKLKYEDVALNIEDMVDQNDWVAIIHADGNGLGQIVQKIGKKKDVFSQFSKNLDKATKQSAVEAFEEIKQKYSWKNGDKDGTIPIRPIVLGGDDFTVICRADLAIDYVTEFIKRFETNTQFDELEGVFYDNVKKLTACAGISFVKSSYPFYYGYNLAEELCSRAKKDAKQGLKSKDGKSQLPESCIMFHKVQDSFVKDLKDIVARELTPQGNISFEYGPYYINVNEAHGEKRWTVDTLIEKVKLLEGEGLKEDKKGNVVKSHLRNWLTLLHDNPGMADQKLIRLKEQLSTDNSDDKQLKDLVVEVTGISTYGFKTPVYDMLAMHTVLYQDTRKEEN